MVLNCLHGKRGSAHLVDGKYIHHFTSLAQPRVGDFVLILTIFASIFVYVNGGVQNKAERRETFGLMFVSDLKCHFK